MHEHTDGGAGHIAHHPPAQADSDLGALHDGHSPGHDPACDCDSACGDGCAVHSPGQLSTGNVLALSLPSRDTFASGADDHPRPTVVTPRLRPPTAL